MAELKLTLNQKEIQQLMECDESGIFTKILQESIDALLNGEHPATESSAESDGAEITGRVRCTAKTRESGNSENALNIGGIPLMKPGDTDGTFDAIVLRNYSVSDAGLIAGMADAACNGESAGKDGIEGLFGFIPCEDEVRTLEEELDSINERFRTRPLTDTYPFLLLSAEQYRIRKYNKTEKVTFLIAMGISRKGCRDIVGYGVYPDPSAASWQIFLEEIRDRGLTYPGMLVSDIYPELKTAAEKVFPDTPWQFCQNDLTERVAELAPEQYADDLSSAVRQAFGLTDTSEVKRAVSELIAEYSGKAPAAMEQLLINADDVMTVYILPEKLRPVFSTTSRLNSIRREMRTRYELSGALPGEKTLGRLLGTYIVDRNEELGNMIRLFYRSAVTEMEEKRGELRSRAAVQHCASSSNYLERG